MPGPRDGGTLSSLQPVRARSDLCGDFVRTLPIGSQLFVLICLGNSLRASKHKIADLNGLKPNCAIV